VGREQQHYGLDMMWYLWEGPHSPIFGKDKMATFERYFLTDSVLQKETKSAYYQYRDDPATCTMILKEFGLTDPDAVILNGHVPVEVKKGESPIKAKGKLIVIDGGFSKAYQGQTGIAGYSLIFNSYGRQLIAHDPFESTAKAIEEELDIAYSETILHQSDKRLRVKELDEGEKIRHKITELRMLLSLFQKGKIKEKVGRYFG
jgi:fructose-1,6-bisphosphatase-3